MARVLIGAMGTSAFEGAEYNFASGQSEISSYFIHALANVRNPDRIIILLTEEAYNAQWDGKDKLKYWIEETLPTVELVPIRIPKGSDQTEAWKIFEQVSQSVPEGSELIVDITNGLRSIPVLLLSAVRYLQLVKKVNVADIYYCAFDTVSRDAAKPAYTLSLFNELLDWSNAVDTFLRTGNSILLVEQLRRTELSQFGKDWASLADVLNKLSQSLDLLRVEEVLKSSANVEKILKSIQSSETPLAAQPFLLLLDEIRKQFAPFAMQDTREPRRSQVFLSKLLDLIDWYAKHQRFAEALLLAREWFITFYMVREKRFDVFNYSIREEIAQKLNDDIRALDKGMDYESVIGMKDLQLWKNLRDARNNLAHPITREPRDFENLVSTINKAISQLRKLNA